MRLSFASFALLIASAVLPTPAFAQETEKPTEPPKPVISNKTADEIMAEELAQEEEPPRPRFIFGPNLGVYLPTNARTREIFGESWENIGLGLGSIRGPGKKGRIRFDFNVINTSGKNKRAFLIPIGAGYSQALGGHPTFLPYYGVSAGLYFANLKADNFDVDTGFKTGVGGSVTLGVTLGEKSFIETRYHAISRLGGFDLSGLNVSTGYRF